MYRRYEPSPQRSRQPASKQDPKPQPHNTNNHRTPPAVNNKNSGKAPQRSAPTVSENSNLNKSKNKPKQNKNSITKFIPQSLYNPKTRKVLGFMDAEDLFIAALIILLIDSGNDDSDNTMLILALLYLLLSEHIDLPI